MAAFDIHISITTSWAEAGRPPSPQPIREVTKELNEQNSVLSRFFENWKRTFAVFALGFASVYTFMTVMRGIPAVIKDVIDTSARWETITLSLAASVASLVELKPGQSLAEGFQVSYKWAESLWHTARRLDAQFIGTAEDLMETARALAVHGVVINTQKKEELDLWLGISTAAKLLTLDIHRQGQLYQEIRAFMQGSVRQGAELARWAAAVDPEYQKNIASLKTIEERKAYILQLSERWKTVSGYISTTWSAISSTLKTIYDDIMVGGFKPFFDWLKMKVDSINKSFYDTSDATQKSANQQAQLTIKSEAYYKTIFAIREVWNWVIFSIEGVIRVVSGLGEILSKLGLNASDVLKTIVALVTVWVANLLKIPELLKGIVTFLFSARGAGLAIVLMFAHAVGVLAQGPPLLKQWHNQLILIGSVLAAIVIPKLRGVLGVLAAIAGVQIAQTAKTEVEAKRYSESLYKSMEKFNVLPSQAKDNVGQLTKAWQTFKSTLEMEKFHQAIMMFEDDSSKLAKAIKEGVIKTREFVSKSVLTGKVETSIYFEIPDKAKFKAWVEKELTPPVPTVKPVATGEEVAKEEAERYYTVIEVWKDLYQYYREREKARIELERETALQSIEIEQQRVAQKKEILDKFHSLGLVSETQYYGELRSMTEKEYQLKLDEVRKKAEAELAIIQAEMDSYKGIVAKAQEEIARLEKERLSASEKERKKIDDLIDRNLNAERDAQKEIVALAIKQKQVNDELAASERKINEEKMHKIYLLELEAKFATIKEPFERKKEELNVLRQINDYMLKLANLEVNNLKIRELNVKALELERQERINLADEELAKIQLRISEIQKQKEAGQTIDEKQLSHLILLKTYWDQLKDVAKSYYDEQIRQATIEIDAIKKHGEAIAGLLMGFREYDKQVSDIFGNMKQAARSIAHSMEDAFMQFLDVTSKNFFNWGNLVRSILIAIYKELLKILVIQPLVNLILSPFRGLLGGKIHGGGLIMHEGGYIPRYHLGVDEVPAILQTGERVLSREQNKIFERLAKIVAEAERNPVSTKEPTQESIQIVNVLDPRLVGEYLATPSGQRMIINVISSQSETIKKILWR